MELASEKTIHQLIYALNSIRTQINMPEIDLKPGMSVMDKLVLVDAATANVDAKLATKIPDATWTLYNACFPEGWDTVDQQPKPEEVIPGHVTEEIEPSGKAETTTQTAPIADKPIEKSGPITPEKKKRTSRKPTATVRVEPGPPISTPGVIDYEDLLGRLMPTLTEEQLELFEKSELVRMLRKTF